MYNVLMAPGLTEFTRIPFGASSHAMPRAIWSTADLDALYDRSSWPYTETFGFDYTGQQCAS